MAFINSKYISMLMLLPPAILAAPPVLAQPAESAQDDYAGEAAERYAQVRVLEGSATIRKGDVEEALSTGVPVGEGDEVESRGRGVLQLGDGSRIAFDAGTRFTVAALFMDRQNERQVLLKLESGRLRIAVGSNADTRIRVDSPSGSVTLGEKGNAEVEMERQGLRVKVFSTRATVQNQEDRVTLGAGEWLVVNSAQDRLSRVREFNTYELDDFENWSGARLALRRSRDLDQVPEEIRPYADSLNGQGEWVYVDEVQARCWRPTGVPEDWRPYWRGRWASYPGGMTWVSDEPWGFVTHHYGRWGWGASLGWYWIPGVQYSPAWVAWQSTDAYFGWAPLGYYDAPCTWGHQGWDGGYCWNVVEINFISTPGLHHHIHRDFRPGWGFPSRPPAYGGGGRPLTPPWQRRPLMVRPGEIRNPGQFRQVAQRRDLAQERWHDYAKRSESSTGRRVFWNAAPSGARPQPGTPGRGFKENERQLPRPERPRSADPLRPGSGMDQRRDTPARPGDQPRPKDGDRIIRRPEAEKEQPRRDPGGVVPPHREQPKTPEAERPVRRPEVERELPRRDPGGAVTPHREQPKTPEADRPVRRPEVDREQPRRDPGGVVPPHREQPKVPEAERPARRPEVEREQPRRETGPIATPRRMESKPEVPKAEAPKPSAPKAEAPKPSHKDEAKDERPRGNR